MACAPPALALPNVAHGLPVFRHCCTEHSLLHRAFTKVQRSPERAHTQPQLPSRYTARERESSGRPKLYTGHGKTHVLVARERDEHTLSPNFHPVTPRESERAADAPNCTRVTARRTSWWPESETSAADPPSPEPSPAKGYSVGRLVLACSASSDGLDFLEHALREEFARRVTNVL